MQFNIAWNDYQRIQYFSGHYYGQCPNMILRETHCDNEDYLLNDDQSHCGDTHLRV